MKYFDRWLFQRDTKIMFCKPILHIWNNLLRPGRLDQLIYIPLPDDGSRMAILKWVSSLFLSSKQGEDLRCHFQSCAYPGLTFANHLWQTTLIFPIWPRFESFLFRTVLLSYCKLVDDPRVLWCRLDWNLSTCLQARYQVSERIRALLKHCLWQILCQYI